MVLLISGLSRVVLVLLLLAVVSGPYVGRAVSEDRLGVSQTFIQDAEGALSSAFLTVLDAEKAGGDVSGLRGRLNDAVSLLSQAKILLAEGDLAGSMRVAR